MISSRSCYLQYRYIQSLALLTNNVLWQKHWECYFHSISGCHSNNISPHHQGISIREKNFSEKRLLIYFFLRRKSSQRKRERERKKAILLMAPLRFAAGVPLFIPYLETYKSGEEREREGDRRALTFLTHTTILYFLSLPLTCLSGVLWKGPPECFWSPFLFILLPWELFPVRATYILSISLNKWLRISKRNGGSLFTCIPNT